MPARPTSCTLAYKAFSAAPSDEEGEAKPPAASGRSLFWRGVLMNVLNPKVALFFLAFLPQFTIASAPEPIWQQMLILGLLFTLQVVFVFGSAGLFRRRRQSTFSRQRQRQVWSLCQ